MPIVPFNEMMAHAQQNKYAVGYFESWNMESLLAVADAAEALRSPVILGFSGIHLPHPQRVMAEKLSDYAALGLEVCDRLSVPACLLFNESAHMDWVLNAIELGFQVVMFTDDYLEYNQQVEKVRQITSAAHAKSVAVEGEIAPLAGAGTKAVELPNSPHSTDIKQAVEFIERTGIDALAVDIGQAHLHQRIEVRLNLDRLNELNKAITVPLVLHAASSVALDDLAEAAKLGISKINVGSSLKRTYLNALRTACMQVEDDYNPYEVIGSGFSKDVLTAGRIALQKTIENLIRLFGSAQRA